MFQQSNMSCFRGPNIDHGLWTMDHGPYAPTHTRTYSRRKAKPRSSIMSTEMVSQKSGETQSANLTDNGKSHTVPAHKADCAVIPKVFSNTPALNSDNCCPTTNSRIHTRNVHSRSHPRGGKDPLFRFSVDRQKEEVHRTHERNKDYLWDDV